ncbi:hypothetical protein V8E36_008734, partial [Tilletia maclaganii]
MAPAAQSDARAAHRAKNRFDALARGEHANPEPGKSPPGPPDKSAAPVKVAIATSNRFSALANKSTSSDGDIGTAAGHPRAQVLPEVPPLNGAGISSADTTSSPRGVTQEDSGSPVSQTQPRGQHRQDTDMDGGSQGAPEPAAHQTFMAKVNGLSWADETAAEEAEAEEAAAAAAMIISRPSSVNSTKSRAQSTATKEKHGVPGSTPHSRAPGV